MAIMLVSCLSALTWILPSIISAILLNHNYLLTVAPVPSELCLSYGWRFRDYSSSLDILTVTICQLLTLQALQIGYLSRRSSEASENINTLYSISEMSRYALDLTEIETKRLRF